MSYARNLARLARAGAPIVDNLQAIRDLTIYDTLYPLGVIARGHTTPGDGGGGYFNILTGQTPGYYTDDNGVTVEFTGGDGSAAAVREIENGTIAVEMCGDSADIIAAFANACAISQVHDHINTIRMANAYTINGGLRVADLHDVTFDFTGAIITQTQVPTQAQDVHTLWLEAVAFGDISNVSIVGGTFTCDPIPTSRVDSNHGIFVKLANGISITGAEVLASHAGGIIVAQCSNITILKNQVGDPRTSASYGTNQVMADGITTFHCGRNLIMSENIVTNTGDDSMACTYFDAADPGDIGETGRQTHSVTITNNILRLSKVRGLFLGGILTGTVSGNVIFRTGKQGINTGGEGNSTGQENSRLNIHDNVLYLPGFGDGVTQQAGVELAGIRIDLGNTFISVQGNQINSAEACGIVCRAPAEITNNIIDIVNDNGLDGGAENLRGTGVFARGGNFIGSIVGNQIRRTNHRPIYMLNCGSNRQTGWTVEDNIISECVADGQEATSIAYIYMDNTKYANVWSNEISDSMTRTTPMQNLIYANDCPLLGYRPMLPSLTTGISGDDVDLVEGSASTGRLWRKETFAPGTGFAVGDVFLSSQYFVAEATKRHRITFRAPRDYTDNLVGWIGDCAHVTADGWFKLTLHRAVDGGGSSADLPSGTWYFFAE